MNIRTADIPPEGITTDEFLGRVAKVRSALDKAGLVGLLAFGDCWRGANIGYFTEFRPLDGVSDIANAILLLPVDGDPVLFVSDQCFDYATSVTAFEVRSLREVTQQVQAFSARHRSGTVGLAGAAYIPADLLQRLNAGLGELKLEPTMVLAEIKAIKSDAEVALMRKAAALTDSAMAAIRDALADGRPYTERELALIADRAMLAGGSGADRIRFDGSIRSALGL
ncbi:M24 family metallopeptidase [Paraburkholderia bengalensis]|uniref:M24 family metallopeptidase n=1 Tax=Paraburkholderia bengalensis TaxID=2747562 RepID=UPI003014F731